MKRTARVVRSAAWLVAGLLCAAPAVAQNGAALPPPPPASPAEAGANRATPDDPLRRLAPRDDAEPTTRALGHVLGRTLPGARVWVGGEPVTVFASGVFARDGLALALGDNAVPVRAELPDGRFVEQRWTLRREPPPVRPEWPQDRLWVDGASLQPAEPLRVQVGEAVEVAAHATPGARVSARLPAGDWQSLAETAPGRYAGTLRFAAPRAEPGAIELRVEAVRPADAAPPAPARPTKAAKGVRKPPERRTPAAPAPAFVARFPGDIATLPPEGRVMAAGPDGAGLLHGLHEVRLGGPFIAELAPGARLRVDGRRGDHLRVRLAPDTTAWVAANSLVDAPPGATVPSAAPTTVSVAGGPQGDVVRVALPAELPYALRAVTGSEGRVHLEAELYGAHYAATWVVQRADARLVREVEVEPAGEQRARLRIHLHAKQPWGWRAAWSAGALQIQVLAPPAFDPAAPLRGLRIALEAGHGGPTNLGAVGATGVPEKDLNRWAVDALREELAGAGAMVVDIRDGDANPTLTERARRVVASGAQLFISLHANAAGTEGGYLRASGVSSYFKHAPSRALAAAVQQRLLATTGLADFGLVGNFNYTPIRRVTEMPSMLVEQAFVSHPGDEARLLDPAWRAALARAVREGIGDFLREQAAPAAR